MVELTAVCPPDNKLGGLAGGRSGTEQVHLRFVGLEPRLQLARQIGNRGTHALQTAAKLVELRIAQMRPAEFFLQEVQLPLPIGKCGLQIGPQFLIDAFLHFRRIDACIGWCRFAVAGIGRAGLTMRRRRRGALRQSKRRARQQAQRDCD